MASINPDVDFVDVNFNKIPGYSGSAVSIINDEGVINLSSVNLTPPQVSLLQKGLNFSPTGNGLLVDKAVDGVNRLHR